MPAAGLPAARLPMQEAAPAASSSSPWAARMGLELYTVRDLIQKDEPGTIAQVAAIGYKEVEPSVTYGGLDPKAYRALLDRYGLKAPTTHMSVTPGPELEKQLEGHQIMGHQYTSVNVPRSAVPTRPRGAAETPDDTKATVEVYNQVGAVAKKYGIKVLVHNHTAEFEKYPGSDQCPYDVILATADPDLVVMELDIGWASVAGQDILAMFHRHPGRFVLWHVKDFMNLQYLFPQPEMTESQRQRTAGRWMVPVGLGGIDYKAIFAQADLAGMKHFNIEQDSAATWGDSIAASRVSYHNLLKAIS
jgi:sugar phosphate isomerase/epimerase